MPNLGLQRMPASMPVLLKQKWTFLVEFKGFKAIFGPGALSFSLHFGNNLATNTTVELQWLIFYNFFAIAGY